MPGMSGMAGNRVVAGVRRTVGAGQVSFLAGTFGIGDLGPLAFALLAGLDHREDQRSRFAEGSLHQQREVVELVVGQAAGPGDGGRALAVLLDVDRPARLGLGPAEATASSTSTRTFSVVSPVPQAWPTRKAMAE